MDGPTPSARCVTANQARVSSSAVRHGEPMKTLTISVADDVYQRASQKAAAAETSLPEVVRDLLSEWTQEDHRSVGVTAFLKQRSNCALGTKSASTTPRSSPPPGDWVAPKCTPRTSTTGRTTTACACRTRFVESPAPRRPDRSRRSGHSLALRWRGGT